MDGMAEYEKLTCLKFRKKQSTDVDYLKFINDDGCYSSVGRQGGPQTLSLGDGCHTYGHVVHELMHAIGFFHEQSRHDRDLYVKILWWNIADGAFRNFATYSHGKGDTLGAPYDLHSILHYGQKAFTKNGGDTLESIDDPQEQLGGNRLSEIDILQINMLYRCFKDSCEDTSVTCMKYHGDRTACFHNLDSTSRLCKKTCGFC